MSQRRPSKPRRRKPSQNRSDETVDFESALQLHAQGRLAEAEDAYRMLIENNAQDASVHHVLGRLLHQRGQREAAIGSIEKALAINPDDTRALNDLGLLYEEVGALDEAAECLTRLITLDPNNATAANNLGVVLKSQQRLPEAVAAFVNAAALQPDFAEAYCNLGNALKRLEDLSGAEAAYRKALEIDPTMLSAYPNFVAVLRRLGQLDLAAEVLSQWLEHEPDNPIAIHLQAACRTAKAPPTQAAEGYVREVFDEFAETFDDHLAKLDYHGPELIRSSLKGAIPTPEPSRRVLDAGCGTGLCGSILKPFSNHLTGVDLSSKMLEKARQLDLYDEIVHGDLPDYLHSNPSSFDVIACADTFSYFGDLAPVLRAAAEALTEHGLLVCTFELGDPAEISSAGYQLMPTGRFRHAEVYLRSSLAQAGFDVEEWIPATLRMEAAIPVRCAVVRAVGQ